MIDRSANGGVTLLRDVGRVILGSENYESIATDLKGKTTVAVGIFQRDGSNALEVSQGIRHRPRASSAPASRPASICR